MHCSAFLNEEMINYKGRNNERIRKRQARKTDGDMELKVVLKSTDAEILSGLDLPETAFTLLVSVWYIFTELGSITENAAKMGAPVPEFLIRALERLRLETAGKDEEKLPIIMGEIAEERTEKEE